jgi:hypothetical protein
MGRVEQVTMPKYTSILCNECRHKLTEKEASVYDFLWQHSGDMYCMKHRQCPDDCRKKPCKLESLIERVIQEPIGRVQEDQDSASIQVFSSRVLDAAFALGREGKWSGGTWRLIYAAKAWRLQVKKEENQHD